MHRFEEKITIPKICERNKENIKLTSLSVQKESFVVDSLYNSQVNSIRMRGGAGNDKTFENPMIKQTIESSRKHGINLV